MLTLGFKQLPCLDSDVYTYDQQELVFLFKIKRMQESIFSVKKSTFFVYVLIEKQMNKRNRI